MAKFRKQDEVGSPNPLVEKFVKPKQAGIALSAGCGFVDDALYLADLGYMVHVVHANSGNKPHDNLLLKLKKTAQERKRLIVPFAKNIRNFRLLKEVYDVILLMLSFHCFDEKGPTAQKINDEDSLIRAADNLTDALSWGGRIIMQTVVETTYQTDSDDMIDTTHRSLGEKELVRLFPRLRIIHSAHHVCRGKPHHPFEGGSHALLCSDRPQSHLLCDFVADKKIK